LERKRGKGGILSAKTEITQGVVKGLPLVNLREKCRKEGENRSTTFVEVGCNGEKELTEKGKIPLYFQELLPPSG